MYQVDPNVNPNVNNVNPNANDPPSVASVMDDSSYVEEEDADSTESSSVSTLYEEETVASGLSAPANLNGASGEQGLQQLAFASSLQLAAAKGQQQQLPVYHAQ